MANEALNKSLEATSGAYREQRQEILDTFRRTSAGEETRRIKAEMVKLEAAAELFRAALTAFGAMKAVSHMLPGIVSAQLPALESAICKYSQASEECAEEVAP